MEHYDQKVIICMPAYQLLEPETAVSLCSVISMANDKIDAYPPTVVDLMVLPHLYIDNARNALVQMVLADTGPRSLGIDYKGSEVTHLLWLDADMQWPKDAVQRLLAHDEDVVGGLYFKKEAPYTPVPYNFNDRDKIDPIKEWGPQPGLCVRNPPPEGLHQVDGLGLGCTLVKTKVFREWNGAAERLAKLNDPKNYARPNEWFSSERSGEEVHFFWHLKRMGYKVFLDYSLKCRHIGKVITGEEHYQMFRQFQQNEAV